MDKKTNTSPSEPTDALNDQRYVDMETGGDSSLSNLPFYKRRSFYYFLLILIAAAVIGAIIGTALVISGVFAPLGVGFIGIAAVAFTTALSALGITSLLSFLAYKFIPALSGQEHSPAEISALEQENELLLENEYDSDVATTPEHSDATSLEIEAELEVSTPAIVDDETNNVIPTPPVSSAAALTPTRLKPAPLARQDGQINIPREKHSGAVPMNPADEILMQFTSAQAQKQITQALRTEAHFQHYTEDDLTRIRFDHSSSMHLINGIEEAMKISEQLQHPAPFWKVSRLEPQNPGEKTLIKISFTPPDATTTKQHIDEAKKKKETYSLLTRKLSILGGVLTLLDDPHFLTENAEQKQIIRQEIAEMCQMLIKGEQNEQSFAVFIDKLITTLANEAQIKDKKAINERVLRPIREAERYFTAEHHKNTILFVTMPQNDGSELIQIDLGFNHKLSNEQKYEYLKIHSAIKPEWFTLLRPEEQAWYQERIPQKFDDEAKWESFENLFKSSAMQASPGLVNFRVNCLIKKKDEELSLLSSSLKSGTPACYETSIDECSRLSAENARQLVEEASHLAQIKFDSTWGNLFQDSDKRPAIPVLIQSLLSAKGLAKADQDLIDMQTEAMGTVTRKSGFKVYYHNDGTNAFNKITDTSISKNSALTELRADTKEFLLRIAQTLGSNELESGFNAFYSNNVNQGKNKNKQPAANPQSLIALIKEQEFLSAEQKLNLIIIINVENELRNMADTQADRNRKEYVVALKKLLIDSMGGTTSNNCKSGKDRTGQSEVYQHALYLYAIQHEGEIISYNAKGKKREEFIRLAANLNASMKIQTAASMNTPGSVGTKAGNISGLIDEDIKKVGLFGKIYSLSCRLAGLNKPEKFTRDEGKKAGELKGYSPEHTPERETIEAANSAQEGKRRFGFYPDKPYSTNENDSPNNTAKPGA